MIPYRERRAQILKLARITETGKFAGNCFPSDRTGFECRDIYLDIYGLKIRLIYKCPEIFITLHTNDLVVYVPFEVAFEAMDVCMSFQWFNFFD